jgi:hypothetical protein
LHRRNGWEKPTTEFPLLPLASTWRVISRLAQAKIDSPFGSLPFAFLIFSLPLFLCSPSRISHPPNPAPRQAITSLRQKKHTGATTISHPPPHSLYILCMTWSV